MLIFALVGGSRISRERVTTQFARLMGATGIVYTMPDTLSDVQRMRVLTEQFDPKGGKKMRLLLNNLRSKAEFDWVRQVGGYVLHVDGVPSDTIAMQQNDFYVTHKEDARGRFDTVEECYTTLRLRYQDDAIARHAHKRQH